MKINDIQNEIIEEMSGLDGWMDKYKHIVKLGRSYDPEDERIRSAENALSGCQFRVWLSARLEGDRLSISADSDSMITKGILALLVRVLNNQPPGDVAGSDLYFIDRIGLSSHLSPSRADGLSLIVRELREHASRSAAA